MENNSFEKKSKIDEIEYTEKNGKKFYKLISEGITYRAFDSSKAFSQLKEGELKVGDSANLQYTETKSGGYVYKNLTKLDKVSTPTLPAQPENKTPEKYSLTTDTRQIIIVRQNALRHADELAKIYGKGGEVMGEAVYFKTAEKIEKWIWRDLNK